MKKLFVLSVVSVMAAFASAQDCCGKKVADCGDAEFMAEAKRMMEASEGKKACCKSTDAKVVVKGEKGCCNAEGEVAKFKVFVTGKGYQFFGCEGSATKGRAAFVAKGHRVGQVQKVASKINIG